jgi:hypothetical protein
MGDSDSDSDSEGGGLGTSSSVSQHQNKKHNRRQERHHAQYIRCVKQLHTLGWRKKFIDTHLDIQVGRELDEVRQMDLIETYTKSWIHIIDSSSDEELLYNAGLKKSVVRKLCEVIKPLYNGCYSQHQLLEIAIEYAIGKYSPLTSPSNAYLFPDVVEDKWSVHFKFKYIFNMSAACNRSSHHLEESIIHGLGTPSHQMLIANQKLFYHATNWSSANNIMMYGISHYQGRACLDFGIQPSFYITPHISTALEFCAQKNLTWSHEKCILVFGVVPNSTLRNKEFDTATLEWIDGVTSSRRCVGVRNELDAYDMVYGPMACNIKGITKRKALARPHHTAKYQLASKSNDSDMYLRHCYIGCIFLKKFI